MLDSNRSVYLAFCRCKDGAGQGCRHLGATLFELDFLFNKRKSVTSVSAYWNPKHKPVPLLKMKMSHSVSTAKKKKRKVTARDDSWIDSFDPRPMNHRDEITLNEKWNLQKKTKKK